MAKFFIDRPIFAIVFSILITLAGLIAAFSLPIAQYPQITPPRINVTANYQGANALVVEQSIAQIIEQKLNGVEGATAIQSTSSDSGKYSLDATFELGKDGDIASVQTQNRVGQANAQLPQEVMQSGIVTTKTSPDTVLFYSLISPHKTFDRVFLKNYSSINIVDELKRIKGVGNVVEYGSDYGMRIWLQPDKMAQLGITAGDIAAAINSQNTQAAAGTLGQLPSVPEQEFQYTAAVQGRLIEPEEFGKIMIRAKADGTFVRVKDVARIELGAKDISFLSDLNGNDSVTVGIQLTADANALDTVSKVRESLDNATKKFPADLEYKLIVDNTKFVTESLHEVYKTFTEALLLVLFIVFIFLQSWRATLIPMLAIPVSLIGTFASFLIMGFSINTLTLFAMVLAIGLVVDDAIVVVEAVEHHMRHSGMSPRDATRQAMEDVSGPVVAIACVLASVFIPVAFFGGTAGVLYKQFALTISISMALSAVVALSLTPALCVVLLKPYDENAHSGLLAKFFDKFNHVFDLLLERYTAGVRRVIRRWGLCMLVLLAIVGVSGTLFKNLPSTYVPSEDQGYFFASVSLPEAASMNRTRYIANQVGDIMRAMPGVQDTIVVTGYDMMAGASKPNAALVVGALKPWSERTTPDLQVDQLVRSIMGKTNNIPDATVIAFNAPALPGIGNVGGISMILQDKGGGSIEDLDQVSKQFVAAARKRPEIGMVNSAFRNDTPGYRFEVNREKAESLGIPVSDVFTALQTYLGGLQVNDFNSFGRTYKVIMQAEPAFRANPDATRFLFLRTTAGTMVPLNTLINAVPTNSATVIKRFNGFRAIQLNVVSAPGYSSGQTMDALDEVANEILPNTFGYEWADQSREEKISGGRAPIIFGFAILFSFLCLAALYESWRIPFSVLLSIPTGLLGSILFEYLRGFTVNVYMQIGLIMLIGLAAKNAILIVEFAKVRVDKGMDPVQAALEATSLRLRPIIMTSFAFILGCIPLATATGPGAGARTAMGTAVVGGMLSATLLGIFIVPVLFVLIEKLSIRIKAHSDKKVSRFM